MSKDKDLCKLGLGHWKFHEKVQEVRVNVLSSRMHAQILEEWAGNGFKQLKARQTVVGLKSSGHCSRIRCCWESTTYWLDWCFPALSLKDTVWWSCSVFEATEPTFTRCVVYQAPASPRILRILRQPMKQTSLTIGKLAALIQFEVTWDCRDTLNEARHGEQIHFSDRLKDSNDQPPAGINQWSGEEGDECRVVYKSAEEKAPRFEKYPFFMSEADSIYFCIFPACLQGGRYWPYGIWKLLFGVLSEGQDGQTGLPSSCFGCFNCGWDLWWLAFMVSGAVNQSQFFRFRTTAKADVVFRGVVRKCTKKIPEVVRPACHGTDRRWESWCRCIGAAFQAAVLSTLIFLPMRNTPQDRLFFPEVVHTPFLPGELINF